MTGNTSSKKKKTPKQSTRKSARNIAKASRSDIQWKKTLPRIALSEFAVEIVKLSPNGPDAKLAKKIKGGKAAGEEWTIFASRAFWIWARICFESLTLAEIVNDVVRNEHEVAAIKNQIRAANNGSSKISGSKKEYETMMLREDIPVFKLCDFNFKHLSQLRHLEFMKLDVDVSAFTPSSTGNKAHGSLIADFEDAHTQDIASTPFLLTDSGDQSPMDASLPRSLLVEFDRAHEGDIATDGISGRFWQNTSSALTQGTHQTHIPGSIVVNGLIENSDYEEELEVMDGDPNAFSDEEHGVEDLRDREHNLQHTLASSTVLFPAPEFDSIADHVPLILPTSEHRNCTDENIGQNLAAGMKRIESSLNEALNANVTAISPGMIHTEDPNFDSAGVLAISNLSNDAHHIDIHVSTPNHPLISHSSPLLPENLDVAYEIPTATLLNDANVEHESTNRQQTEAANESSMSKDSATGQDVLANDAYDLHFPCYNAPPSVQHLPIQAFFESAGLTKEGSLLTHEGIASNGIQLATRKANDIQRNNNKTDKENTAVDTTNSANDQPEAKTTDLAHTTPTQPNAWNKKSKKIFQNVTNGGKLNFIKPNPSLCMKVDLEKARTKYDVWGWSLLGHYVGYAPNHYMLMNVIRAWGVPAKYSLEEGWIVFRFNTEEDMDKVLMKSPYYIYNKPLIIKKIPDYFAYNRSAIATIPVWVRIYGLAKEFWTEEILSEAASYVGTPLFKDHVTEQGTKSSYARVMVEVNFSTPITKKITLEYAGESCAEVTFFIENEPIFCIECMSFGHVATGCTTKGRNMAHKRFQNGSVGAKDTSTTDIVTTSEGTTPMGAAEESGGISDGVPKEGVTKRDVFSRLEGKGFKLGKNGKNVTFVAQVSKNKGAYSLSKQDAHKPQYEKGESSRARHTADRGLKFRTRKIWVPKCSKPQDAKKMDLNNDGDNSHKQPSIATNSHVNMGADMASNNVDNEVVLRANNIPTFDSINTSSPTIDLQRLKDGSVGTIVIHEQTLSMAQIEQMIEQLMHVSRTDRDLLIEKYFETVARHTGKGKEQITEYYANEEMFEHDTCPNDKRRKGENEELGTVHSSMGRGGCKKAS